MKDPAGIFCLLMKTTIKVSDSPTGNLSQAQVKMIAEALESVGAFGEVRLVVQNGRLRFLVTQKSFDALKYTPGAIRGDR